MKIIIRFLTLLLVLSQFALGACSGSGRYIFPVADAGEDLVVASNISSVNFDGGNSFGLWGDGVTYEWQLVLKPTAANATLLNQYTATPTLNFDAEGLYRVSLVVSDGINESAADYVDVTVVAGAKNIILLIGDGMGFEQVRAAGMYANGAAGTLSFEELPFTGSASNLNAQNGVVDSASAATSIATGVKVDNGVISVALPGDGFPLETILERLKAKGASTGLVTTTIISHATPAAFGAHEVSRQNYDAIITDYLTETKPNVLLGGALYIDPLTASDAGYTVVEDLNGLEALNTETVVNLWGQFGETSLPFEYDGLGAYPHLSESTASALAILDNDQDGFFLMIEGGKIDHAGHINDLPRNVFETIEFSNAVQVVKDWADGRTDTLVIVTADHETGGLEIVAANGAGLFPEVNWTTAGHTEQQVPVYGWGVNAHLLSGEIENTDIYGVMRGAVQ